MKLQGALIVLHSLVAPMLRLQHLKRQEIVIARLARIKPNGLGKRLFGLGELFQPRFYCESTRKWQPRLRRLWRAAEATIRATSTALRRPISSSLKKVVR